MSENLLKVIDASLALMEVQQRYMQLAQKAQLEGRDVRADELDELQQANAARRAQWDDLTR